ncbi:MAG: hypothetical protein AB7G11_04655 [Phycisphaerales bacterium]
MTPTTPPAADDRRWSLAERVSLAWLLCVPAWGVLAIACAAARQRGWRLPRFLLRAVVAPASLIEQIPPGMAMALLVVLNAAAILVFSSVARNTRNGIAPANIARSALRLAAPVLLVLVVVQLVPTVLTPMLERSYSDYGVRLPGLARFLLNVSSSLRGSNPGQAVPLVFLLGVLYAPLLLVIRRPWRNAGPASPGAHRGVRRGTIAVATALLLIELVGLAYPLIAMWSSLRGGSL